MQRWEFVLQERYEQDRMRLLNYREINLEFKEWLLKLFYEEVTKTDERNEHSADDDPVRDDRICDRERIRPEQDQIADPGSDHPDGERTESGEEVRIAEIIAAEPAEEYLIEASDETVEEDIYESFYEEIDRYKNQQKAKPKKKHYKRKG